MSLLNGTGKLDASVAGQLTIKASVGEDIRRIPIHNDDLTYDELVLMMQRVFKGVLKSDEDLVLKYRDEDGDLVSLVDTNDLSHALQVLSRYFFTLVNILIFPPLQYSRVLRLTILHQQEAAGAGAAADAEVVRELRQIRDRVNHILDLVTTECKVGWS